MSRRAVQARDRLPGLAERVEGCRRALASRNEEHSVGLPLHYLFGAIPLK
jgi:hypothetical protein